MTSAQTKTTGSCFCGRISYQVAAGGGLLQYCHCSRCRKFTGGAHAANLIVAREGFRWLQGEDWVQEFTPEHTRHFRTSFCRRCGSSLPWLAKNGRVMVIPAGGLDAHPGVEPKQNIFWASRAPWYRAASDLPQHEQLPLEKSSK